jgi:hypothetical protein
LTSKEDTMMRRLLSLTPANLVHELGSGRALENARRDHDELARMSAVVDALAGRIPPAGGAGAASIDVTAARSEKERVAA